MNAQRLRRATVGMLLLLGGLGDGECVAQGTPPGPGTTLSLSEIDARLSKVDQKIAQHAASLDEPQPSSWWSATDAMTISSVVLLFGVLVIILAYFAIQKGQPPEAILRMFGTIVIIVSAVFLVVAGYNDKQIAPVMGLLGTIVGYLLGKEPRPPAEPPTPK